MTEKDFRQKFEKNLAKETLYEEWKKKDQRIKELESQLNITKLKLHESKQDFEKLKQAYAILKNKKPPINEWSYERNFCKQ